MQNAQSNDLSTSLSSLPGWDKMTAYHRVLEACRELTKAGRKIPAWTTLRELVGKGSPADIQRAVEDFRHQNAVLMNAGNLELEAAPASVVKAFKGIWMQALREAENKFSSQRSMLDEEAAKLRQRIFQAELRLDQEADARKQADENLSSTRLELEKKVWELAGQSQTITELHAELAGRNEKLSHLTHENFELGVLLNNSQAAIEVLKSKEIDLVAQLERAEARIDSLLAQRKSKAIR